MESWQKTFVEKHLPDIVEKTETNPLMLATLLAEKILNKVDLENMKATRETEGKEAENKLLFEKLLTRTNSYKAFGQAAYKSKQYGTFFIFLKGVVEHLLKQCRIDLTEESLYEILNAKYHTKDAFKFFVAKMNKMTIYDHNMILAPHSLYIPRLISNRIKLNPDVFNQKCADIFVFNGLDRIQLSNLAGTNHISDSTTVIFKKVRNVKFVLLQNPQDWDKLRTVWSEPVHLIRFDSYTSEFILQDSTQSSAIVTSHIPLHLREKPLYILEEYFFNQFENEMSGKTICICDTPGMGKTWLLENIAHKSQERACNSIVGFISLQHFIQHLNTTIDNNITNLSAATKSLLRYLCSFELTSSILEKALHSNKVRLELLLDGFDEIPNEKLTSAKLFFEALAENFQNVRLFITSRPHMRNELKEAFNADVYDILPFSEKSQIEYFVRFWKNCAEIEEVPNIQTKRLRSFAKACLMILRNELTKADGEIMGVPLQCFIMATINVKNALMYASRDTSSNANDFLSVSTMYDMYDMYINLGLDRATKNSGKFTYQTQITKKQGNLNKNSSALDIEERQKLKDFLVWKALQLLLPELADDYFQIKNVSYPKSSEQLHACGIFKACTTNEESFSYVIFLHKSFAEFLVAEYFADIITGCCHLINTDVLRKHQRLFFESILSTQKINFTNMSPGAFFRVAAVHLNCFEFINATIVYILNACLQRNTVVNMSEVTSIGSKKYLLDGNARKILCSCISSNHVCIIRLLIDVFKNAASDNSFNVTLRDLLIHPVRLLGNINGISTDKQFLSCCEYLCQAANMSDVRALEELFKLFEECFNENLNDTCSNMPTELVTPLHYAVARHDYHLVEFFIQKITLSKRCLVYLCLSNMRLPIDEDSMEIYKLLMATDKSIILDVYETINPAGEPFLVGGIIVLSGDVNFIKFAVQQGANIRATYIESEDVDTVLTKNARSMYKKEFIELCQYLLNDVKALDLFRPNLPHWENPLPRLLRNVDEPTLIQILQIPEIQINEVDRKGNNILLTAIRHNDDISVIKHLIDAGVDLFSKNCKDKNALHFAVASGNLANTKLLVTAGISVNQKDSLGNISLHYATKIINISYKYGKIKNNFKFRKHYPEEHQQQCFDMLKYIIEQDADVLAVNNDGNNIAHILLTSKHEDKRILTGNIEYLSSLPQGPELFKTTNNQGRTPLHEWLACGKVLPDIEMVERILRLGEDIKSVDLHGNNMLLTAAARQIHFPCMKCYFERATNQPNTEEDETKELEMLDVEAVDIPTEFFLSMGTPPEHDHINFGSPISRADFIQKTDLIKYLIERGADTFSVTDTGNNIAHLILLSKYDGFDASTRVIDFLSSLKEGIQLLRSRNNLARTPLHENMLFGSLHNDPETIKLILQSSGENVNATCSNGDTMFLSAVRKQEPFSVLKSLIALGANYNSTSKFGRTALHISAELGNLEIAKFFVSIGMSMEHQDNAGHTALLLAAYFENMDVLKFLLSKHANIFSVSKGGNNIAHMMLTKKHDNKPIKKQNIEFLISLPQAPELLKITNMYGRTPLHESVLSGRLSSVPSVIELILQTSAEDINAMNSHGDTMFLAAARQENSLSLLKSLMALGANHNKADNVGRNALHISAAEGNLVYCQYFVSIGISPELTDNEGNTPVLLAAYYQKLDVLKYLIEQRACILAANFFGNNIAHMLLIPKHDDKAAFKQIIEYLIALPQGPELFQMKNKITRTPLHSLIASDNLFPDPETVELILTKSGEDINGTDSSGNTMFLTAATKKDSTICLKTLKRFGANTNAVCGHGINALQYAASYGHLDAAKYCVSIGVSLENRDNDGDTAILQAAYSQHLDVVKYFTEQQANALAVNNNKNTIAHYLLGEQVVDRVRLKDNAMYLISLPQASQLLKMKNTMGRTALHHCIASENLLPDANTVEIILSTSKEDVNATDTQGNTICLTAAKKKNSLTCLKCFRKNGANYSVRNKDGYNALDLARIGDAEGDVDLEVVDYLVSIECSSSLNQLKF